MWIQYSIAAAILAAGTVMDIRTKRISRLLPGIYLGAVIAGKTVEYMAGLRSEQISILLQNMGTGMIPGIICLLLSVFTGQAFGYGDSLLILVCGIGMGAAECMKILMIALAGAAAWGLFLLLVRKADRKQEIPFVPFLLLGVLVCMFHSL